MNFAFYDISDNEQIVKKYMTKKFAALNQEISFTSFTAITDLLQSNQIFDYYIIDAQHRSKTEEALTNKIKDNAKKDYGSVVGFIFYLQKQLCIADLLSAFQCISPYIKQKLDNPYFEFLSEQGLKNIRIKDIIYFEYINRKVILKTTNSYYVIIQKISTVLNMFETVNFLMPHKSFVINLSQIVSIKNYEIIMTDGTIIPLSQKRSREFRKKYKQYLNKQNNKIL